MPWPWEVSPQPEHLVHDHGYCIWCCFGLQLSHILLKWFIWVFQEGMVTEPTMWPWLWPHSWLSLSWSNFEVAMFQEWEGRLTLNERDGGLSFMTMTLTIWWRTWSVRIYWTVTGVTLDQRCVVRGMALSSLLSCRLLANLNSRGSPVAPTCADPEAEASTGQFTRVWSGGHVLRGGATRGIVSDVSPGHAGRQAWTRASESSQSAAQTSCPEPARRVSFAWVRR